MLICVNVSRILGRYLCGAFFHIDIQVLAGSETKATESESKSFQSSFSQKLFNQNDTVSSSIIIDLLEANPHYALIKD